MGMLYSILGDRVVIEGIEFSVATNTLLIQIKKHMKKVTNIPTFYNLLYK